MESQNLEEPEEATVFRAAAQPQSAEQPSSHTFSVEPLDKQFQLPVQDLIYDLGELFRTQLLQPKWVEVVCMHRRSGRLGLLLGIHNDLQPW